MRATSRPADFELSVRVLACEGVGTNKAEFQANWEIASAAELVMGKASGVPVAVVRGLSRDCFRDSSVRELIRPVNEDLFR